MSERVVQTLEPHQAQCSNHFPEDPVSMPNHLLDEESCHNIQHEPPLSQLHTLSLSPVAVAREELSASPSTPLMKKLRDALSPPLRLLFSQLNKSSDFSCFSSILPYRHFRIFSALLWTFFNSFKSLYCDAQN